MGIERNRVVPSAPQAGGLRSLLETLNRQAPPPSPAPAGVKTLLDRLSLARERARTPAPAAADGAQAVALLATPGQAARLTPAQWQAAASAYQAAAPSGRAAIASQLAQAGVRVEAGADGRYVSFSATGLRAIVEPASQRLRRTVGSATGCYEGGQLLATMKREGDRVSVTTRSGTQVWQDGTGQGYADGLPIVPKLAPRVPGEPPRRGWVGSTRDELDEPEWDVDTEMTAYAPAYDEAVEEAGGQVLEPSDPAAAPSDLYNCHSFATTGGAGDLFDPFLRESHPHWLNNPMARLTNGGFAKLSDTQRVHAGDVIVYRLEGQVTHTGVVREVDRNGNPALIESKFGVLGLYLHEPFDVPGQYGAPAEYWRPAA